jgi:ABC-type phosphate transport system substrate-binding protein
MKKLAVVAVPVLVALLGLAGCGGSESSSSPSSTTTTADSSASPTTSASGTSTAKVNANTASQAEIAAALEAAGVPNADRWAGEVVEYRPYATDDPTFAKLKQNLAKYNPGDAVVTKIISALTL